MPATHPGLQKSHPGPPNPYTSALGRDSQTQLQAPTPLQLLLHSNSSKRQSQARSLQAAPWRSWGDLLQLHAPLPRRIPALWDSFRVSQEGAETICTTAPALVPTTVQTESGCAFPESDNLLHQRKLQTQCVPSHSPALGAYSLPVRRREPWLRSSEGTARTTFYLQLLATERGAYTPSAVFVSTPQFFLCYYRSKGIIPILGSCIAQVTENTFGKLVFVEKLNACGS